MKTKSSAMDTIWKSADLLVVDMLLRLKHSSTPTSWGWGARQPRSSCTQAGMPARRCSPSTPLSWNSSGGGHVPTSTSKISLAGSEVNRASNAKSRKKKTYSDLKGEEDMLLKERIHLNQELATLIAAVKEHRTENESLKRIKLNLNTQTMKCTSCTGEQKDAPSKQAVSVTLIPGKCNSSSIPCHAETDDISRQNRSMLPDLNMIPPELESIVH